MENESAYGERLSELHVTILNPNEENNHELEDMFRESDEIYRIAKLSDQLYASIMGFIVGDAMGVPYEFRRRGEFHLDSSAEMVGYGSHSMPEGTWSDDSSMVLASMDSIAEKETADYQDIMNHYVGWYQNGENTATGKVFDIGNTTRRALTKYIKGEKYYRTGQGSESDNGNGSLMRVLPLSILLSQVPHSEKEAVEAVYYYSGLTHSHNISIMGCKLFTDIYLNIIQGKNLKEAVAGVANHNYAKYYTDYYVYNRILSGEVFDLEEDEIRSGGYVVDTLEAALWSLSHSNNYEEAITTAINLGDDTDTVAAITGSLAGLIYGIESIPTRWVDKLQNEEFVEDKIDSFIDAIMKIKSKYNVQEEATHIK